MIQKDSIQLAPEIGVKHVVVQKRIVRILQRAVRTQKDVFVHSLFVAIANSLLACHLLQLHIRLLEKLTD